MILDSKIILNYVLKNFLLKYEAERFKDAIGFEANDLTRVIVNASGLSYFKNNTPSFPSAIYKKEYNGREIPFLFGDPAKHIIESNGNKTTINADIISSAFYFLSGWQERNVSEHDQYGRFRYLDSIQYKLNITELPVVNYYFIILKDAIEKAFNVKIETRKKEPLSCFISHDIDDWEKLWMQEAFHALKKFKLLGVVEFLIYKVSGTDVNKTFEKLSNLEKKHNIKSTFFFLPQKDGEVNTRNADYDLGKKRFQVAIKDLSNHGNEIGVHGSFFTHDSSARHLQDKKKIETITNGIAVSNRFHFLCFDVNKTPQILEQNGIRYDSTLGFAEQIGFRNSFADPFYLFDWQKMNASSVLEFPQAIMDATFYFAKYLNVDGLTALKRTEALINEVIKVNGCLVFNWHNTSYMKYKRKGWDKILDKIIESCLDKGATFYTFTEYVQKNIQPR